MAVQDHQVWVNGKMIPWKDATVHLMSHSLTRGSAIFEVLAVHSTARGPAAFRLPDHVDRLFRSAELLGMELVQSKDEIVRAVIQTAGVNRLQEGFVKIVGYYSEETFSISVSNPRLDLSVFAISGEEYRKHGTSSIRVCLSRWRKLHPETVPVEAKVAANYLNGMLARQDAARRGFDLAVLLDTHGFLGEGSVESVFIVKGGILLTPPLGLILSSISRRSILEAAQAAGIRTMERPIRREEFLGADEIFTASTSRRVMPVSCVEDRDLGQVPGPLTRRLASLMEAICSGKDERFRHWLQPVE